MLHFISSPVPWNVHVELAHCVLIKGVRYFLVGVVVSLTLKLKKFTLVISYVIE